MLLVWSECGDSYTSIFQLHREPQLRTEIRNWSTSCTVLPGLTEKNKYLGWFDNLHNTLINHTIILYKQCIYKNRGAKSKINIIGFRHFLKSVINIEKVIAKKRNKVDIHLWI